MTDNIATLSITINAKENASKALDALEKRLQQVSASADSTAGKIGLRLASAHRDAARAATEQTQAEKALNDQLRQSAGVSKPRATGGGGASSDLDKEAAAARKAANEALALSKSQAQGAKLAGDYAQAQAILTRGIDAYAAAGVKGAAAENRLQQARNTLAVITNRAEGNNRSLLGSLDQISAKMGQSQGVTQGLGGAFSNLEGVLGGLKGGLSSLTSAFGALGVGIGAAQLLQFGVDAGRAALALEQTKTITKSLAGDTNTYNTVVAAATRQQQLFGGSLNENLDGLKGLIITARSSGGELEKLIDLSQRLSVLDPEQGTAGARVALSEALSGDPRSLAARYEIPRKALAAIKDESKSTAERLQVLDQYLNKIGITSGIVASSVPQATIAFNNLGTAADNAKNSIGGFLAEKTAPLAQTAADLLNARGQIDGFNQSLLQSSGSFSQYQTGVQGVNAQTQGLRTQLQQMSPYTLGLGAAFAALIPPVNGLSEAQYNYARALVASGTAVDQAIQKAQQYDALANMIKVSQDNLASSGKLSADEIKRLADELARLSALSGGDAQNIQAITQAFLDGRIGAEEFKSAISGMSQDYANLQGATGGATQATAENAAALRAQAAELQGNTALANSAYGAIAELANGTQGAKQAASEQSQALVDQAQKTQAATMEAQRLDAFQRDLEQAGIAAANGHQSAGAAAITLAGRYGIALDAALALIRAQAQLSGMSFKLGAVSGALTAFGGSNKVGADALRNLRNQELLLSAKGEEAALIANLREQQKYLNKDSSEYYQLQAKIISLEKSGSKKGKGGGAPKLSDQQKLNNQLSIDQLNADNKAEQAEKDHSKRLLQIQEDYDKKALAAQKKFNMDRLDANVSFYDSLASIKDPKLQQSLSAQYEAAALKAQEVAAEKGADVADAYLKAEQARIQDEGQRQAKIDALLSTTDESGKKKSKAQIKRDQNDAKFEQGRLELAKKANQAKVDAALAGEDSIAQQRDQALSDEQAKYEETLGKIDTSVQNSAERRVTAAQLAGKAVDDERTKVEQLGAAYDRLGGRPTATPSAPTTATSSVSPDAAGATQSAATDIADKPVSLNSRAAQNGATLDTVADLLSQAIDAIRAVSGDVRNGANKVAGAVSPRAVS